VAKQVLLIHGGGGGAFEADARLADSLRVHLGEAYEVRYPRMPEEETPDYATWKRLILEQVGYLGGAAILVGHSIGASVLIKVLADTASRQSIAGLFLVSAPFWQDDEFWRWDEVALSAETAARVPHDLPLFLYHGEDDEFVPVAHVDMYARFLPHAVVRRLPGRDHQINDDLSEVARDIERLA